MLTADFTIERDDEARVLRAVGEVDLGAEASLDAAVHACRDAGFALDVSGVTFIDVAGLRQLERVASLGIPVVGTAPPIERIRELLQLAP